MTAADVGEVRSDADVPSPSTEVASLESVVARDRRWRSNRHAVILPAADTRLIAFVAYEQALGRLDHQLVWDARIRHGLGHGRGGAGLASLSPNNQAAPWISDAREVVPYSCDDPLLRRVAAPRLMHVTVTVGGTIVVPVAADAGPSTRSAGARMRE